MSEKPTASSREARRKAVGEVVTVSKNPPDSAWEGGLYAGKRGNANAKIADLRFQIAD